MWHTMMSTDFPEHVQCLTCGGMWVERAEGVVVYGYETIWGEPADDCTGLTDRVHGYPGERFCLDCEASDCSHTQHDCNCLRCDS